MKTWAHHRIMICIHTLHMKLTLTNQVLTCEMYCARWSAMHTQYKVGTFTTTLCKMVSHASRYVPLQELRPSLAQTDGSAWPTEGGEEGECGSSCVSNVVLLLLYALSKTEDSACDNEPAPTPTNSSSLHGNTVGCGEDLCSHYHHHYYSLSCAPLSLAWFLLPPQEHPESVLLHPLPRERE